MPRARNQFVNTPESEHYHTNLDVLDNIDNKNIVKCFDVYNSEDGTPKLDLESAKIFFECIKNNNVIVKYNTYVYNLYRVRLVEDFGDNVSDDYTDIAYFVNNGETTNSMLIFKNEYGNISISHKVTNITNGQTFSNANINSGTLNNVSVSHSDIKQSNVPEDDCFEINGEIVIGDDGSMTINDITSTLANGTPNSDTNLVNKKYVDGAVDNYVKEKVSPSIEKNTKSIEAHTESIRDIKETVDNNTSGIHFAQKEYEKTVNLFDTNRLIQKDEYNVETSYQLPTGTYYIKVFNMPSNVSSIYVGWLKENEKRELIHATSDYATFTLTKPSVVEFQFADSSGDGMSTSISQVVEAKIMIADNQYQNYYNGGNEVAHMRDVDKFVRLTKIYYDYSYEGVATKNVMIIPDNPSQQFTITAFKKTSEGASNSASAKFYGNANICFGAGEFSVNGQHYDPNPQCHYDPNPDKSAVKLTTYKVTIELDDNSKGFKFLCFDNND